MHLAVSGGNLQLIKWLIEVKKCAIAERVAAGSAQTKPLLTATGLSLLGVACYRGHKDVMNYLLHEKHARVQEITDVNILQRGLHVAMQVQYTTHSRMR